MRNCKIVDHDHTDLVLQDDETLLHCAYHAADGIMCAASSLGNVIIFDASSSTVRLLHCSGCLRPLSKLYHLVETVVQNTSCPTGHSIMLVLLLSPWRQHGRQGGNNGLLR